MRKRISTLAAALALTLVGTGALPTGLTEPERAAAYSTSAAMSIAAGYNFSGAVAEDGTLWMWGNNWNGKSGNGTTTFAHYAPTRTVGLTDMRSLSLGYNHGLALKNDGTVWGWGRNNYGQITGTAYERTIPALLPGLSSVAAVTAGNDHSLAVRTDGTVWSWGYNSNGQLGLGTAGGSVSAATQVPGISDVKSVAGGGSHSLALKNDGTVWGWGASTFYQLGFRPPGAGAGSGNALTPTQVPNLTDVKQVAAGEDYSLALKNDGTVWGWGRNSEGEVGVGQTPDIVTTPTQLPGLTDIIQIVAGTDHAAAVKADGTLWLWGQGEYGQLGEATTAIPYYNRYTPAPHPTLNQVAEVAAGHQHTIVKQKDGAYVSFGANSSGALGVGNTTTQYNTPQDVMEFYSLDLKATPYGDKLLLKWRPSTNAAQYSYIVNGSSYKTTKTEFLHGPIWPSTATQVKVEALNKDGVIIASQQIQNIKNPGGTVAAGEYHTLAAKADRTLWAWGYNAYGQLGNNNTTNQSSPVKAGAFTTALSPGAGYGFSLVRDSSAKLWTWGQNNYSQLGYAAADMSLAPKVLAPTNVMTWDATYHHALLVDQSRRLFVWGRNDRAQLGNGTTTNVSTPTLVTFSEPISPVSVATGFQHSLIVNSQYRLYSVGRNDLGQLGLGHTTQATRPVEIVGLTDVIGAAAGSLHSLALKQDGTVWAWGYNVNGQLGDGTTETRLSPVQVQGLTDVVAISAGYGHSLALKQDGTVWAWGYNFNGQLGNGTRTHSSVPVQVHNLTDIVELNAGGYHNIAKKADGTYWTWGNNSYGQLGDGTTTYSTEPVQSWSPFSLSVYATSSNTNSIKLSLSSAGASVAKYVIKRDGAVVHQGLFTGFLDSNLSPNTPYAHTVEAYDATGKLLGSKSVVTATLSDMAMIEGVDAEPFFKEEIYPLEDVQQPEPPTKKGGKHKQ